MKRNVIICFVFTLNIFVICKETFNYEQMHFFGLGRRIFNRGSRFEFPDELPKSSPAIYIRPPYKNLYQGVRNKGDKRVYNKWFRYPPQLSGHHIFCEGVFDCPISHMSLETNQSIPIILRGGVGYKYFSVVVKAHPGKELSARVRAYCGRSLEPTTTVTTKNWWR